MTEQFATVGDHEIAYDTFGDPQQPAVLMVMGLGAQLIHWDPRLCQAIADRGFHVIRFDNRDIGRSRHYPELGTPNVIAIALGARKSAPYRLRHLADDAVGLLDHLGIGRAHLVGASLGGAIVQTIAINHPTRVLTLTSVMGPSGATFAELPRLRILPAFLRRSPGGDPAEATHRFNALIRSPGFPFDADADLARVRAGHERAFDPEGIQRQLGALLASGSRRKALRDVQAPTLVIHGRDDPLVPVRAGRAVARAVPDARLEILDGMGHDAPEAIWPQLVRLLTDHALAHPPMGQGRPGPESSSNNTSA